MRGETEIRKALESMKKASEFSNGKVPNKSDWDLGWIEALMWVLKEK